VGDRLQTGTYGTLEPDPALPQVNPDTVDLILVPAVACDRQGYRLGYGGGFYDRLFNIAAWACKRKVGIVFEFALIEQLPVYPWDQPMEGICSDLGIHKISS
jgi:5-formyltetrahydrofolate cyclo-ligase